VLELVSTGIVSNLGVSFIGVSFACAFPLLLRFRTSRVAGGPATHEHPLADS
jgi:hypothetical protein